ncbi:putative Ig domain-containing protein [Agrobacterium fabrum]|uniref:putative Ig domain-containing protein n=1 Tax=Agrobacterium fabrum TaxID=1176649 RepID=UPI003B9F2156
MTLAFSSSFVSPALAASSAACTAINSGSVDYSSGATAPGSMSGTYTARSSGWDLNVVGWNNAFAAGEVISYSYSSSGTSPYVHIQLADVNGTPYSSSALNRTGSGSGSFTVQAASDYVNLSAMTFQLDAGGNVVNSSEDPSKEGAQATITLSCAAVSATPTLTSLSPSSGTTAGGTQVTIIGTNFSTTPGDNVVRFGTDTATVTAATATELTVTVPAHNAGQVNVSITVSGQTATLNNGYTYIEPAVAGVASLTVSANSSNNSVPLSITGGVATSVAVDTQATHGTANVSGTSITYTPNSGYSGTDSFTYTATNAAGTSSSATVTITVNPVVAALTSVSPASGTTDGGETVTLTGSGFTGATSVTIGGRSATSFTVVSDTTIEMVTPATVAGSHTVTVSTPVGQASQSGGFTSSSWSSAPIVTGISPDSGTASGGTSVTISGMGFSTATGVNFGGVSATSFTVVSDGQIDAVTPAHALGLVGVEVTSAGGDSELTDSFTYLAPTITLIPSAGALPSAQAGAAYSQSVTASGGTASYAYSLTNGALPSGVTISAGGGISGTPVEVGAFSFTITATDANGHLGTAAYTLNVSAPSIIVSPSTLPAGILNNAYSQTVVATGGTAAYTYGVTAGALPSGLTLSTAGVLSGTPTAIGSFNFTITATDSTTGGAAPYAGSQNYILTTTAMGFSFTPAAGSLPGGTKGVAYTQAITVSGGSSPYTYAITAGSLPPGLSLNSTTGAVEGIPTTQGSYNFTITASDLNNDTSNAAYSLVIAEQAPITANVSATVLANSANNPIALNITGGLATSVAIGAQASHGTASATGTSITYTPDAGYSGTDSFTYTATNATGTSVAATVTITVTTPVFSFSPASGALPAGTTGTAYSQPVTASGGTAPYTYAVVGSLPPGLTLDLSTGLVSGMPTSAGSWSFSITATDTNNVSASAAYSIVVASAPVVAFVFTPVAGPLQEAMAGEVYSQPISARGGAGALVYSLISGTLPTGTVLNVSTGALTGPIAPGAEGNYTFTIQVRDTNGATGTASYTVKVKERDVTVTDKEIQVPAGSTPANVDLTRGSTGGPFTSADIVLVEPPNAGTVSIVRGEFAQAGPVGPLGWYLKFTPNPAYSGRVRVGFRLTSALGSSNTGTVTYMLAYDAAEVASEIDGLVHGFVQARQNLIASAIQVPGLLERRKMATATDPLTARMMPSEQGMTVGFSTSLSQLEAARDGADLDGSSPFNIWIDGTFLMHKRDADQGEGGGKWGSFGMVSAGADYLLSYNALVGVSVHFDRMTDPTNEDAELTGNGWFAGPYASFEIGKGVFWDTSLLYGGSANDIDTAFWDGSFDTTRWMIDTAIKGQWNLDDVTVLTPKLRAIYFSESVDDYTVKNAAGDELGIDGFTAEQLRISVGAEIARQFTLESGSALTPKFGLTGGFSGLDGSGAFGSVTAGVNLQTVDAWSLDFSLLFNIEGEGETSAGAKAGVSKRF